MRDAECGYRYARSIASDHAGDLNRPVTFLGWSLGALFVVQAGLDEEIDPSGQYVSCFSEVARPDLTVALSGCYYQFEGTPVGLLDPSRWANEGADLVLTAGDGDTVCPAAQSQRATAELRSRGYDVRYELLADADHDMVIAPDQPAGHQVVDLIVNAIADR